MEKNDENDERLAQLYERLKLPSSSRWIRLLCIQARRQDEATDAPIHCELVVRDLDSNPWFSALSYTWDVASGYGTITCGGFPIEVTANCLSALQHLRVMHGSLMIWVDAVCINQKDQHEKQQQIALMAQIYSKASSTYCWIGEESESTCRVAAYLSQTGFLKHFYLNGDPIHGQRLGKSRRFCLWIDLLKVLLGLSPTPLPYKKNPPKWLRSACTFQELSAYLDCQWIDRIWTYQEIAFSSNPIIVRGSTQVFWAHFKFSVVFLACLHHHGPMFKWLELITTHCLLQDDAGTTSKNTSDMRDYAEICLATKLRVIAVVELSVWMVMSTVWFAFAGARIRVLYHSFGFLNYTTMVFLTMVPVFCFRGRSGNFVFTLVFWLGHIREQSDKVRKFMGATLYDNVLRTLRFRTASEARDLSFGLHSVLDRISGKAVLPPVDYSLPTREVFKQLTTYLIAKGGLGAVLELAAHNSYNGAPSWVPDYCQTFETLRDLKSYATADSKSLCWIHPDDPTELHVKGLVFCTIKSSANDQASSIFQFQLDSEFEQDSGCNGWSFNAVSAGDRIALVSGVSFPLVVRKIAAGRFTLIGPAFLSTAPPKNKGRKERRWDDVMKGAEWSRAKKRGLIRDIIIV